MARTESNTKSDVEKCADEILKVLQEYGCRIETDDYCSAWLVDLHTNENGRLWKNSN